MARPRAFDRDAALQQAMFLFWEREYARCSVRDLTARMGIGLQSLYAAFGDKRRLLDEAVALYLATPRYLVARDLDGLPAREGIAMMLERAAVGYTDPSHPPGCLLINEPLLGAERAAAEHALGAYLAGAGLPAGVDTAALSGFYATVLRGFSARARDGASASDLQRAAEFAMAAWPQSRDG